MELFEEDELTESELNAMLRTWESPAAPERIRNAVFPAREAWWRRGIRVPLPVAICVAALLMAFVWWRTRPVTVYRDRVTPVTVYRDRPTPVIVYRDRILPAPNVELRPVTRLEPRIVRDSDAQN